MAAEEAQRQLKKDVSALQLLMAKIRHMSALTGDALWQNHRANSLLNTGRALSSAITLGAVPSTALMDIGTTIVNKTFGRTFMDVILNFIKYFINKSYRAEIKEDLRALGFCVENGLNSSTGKFSNS